MNVKLISGRIGPEGSGLKTYTLGLYNHLKDKINISFIQRDELNIPFSFLFSILNYPFQIKKVLREDDIVHLTSQGFCYILNFNIKNPTVLTCHDTIAFSYPQTCGSFFHQSYEKLGFLGIERVDKIVAASMHTKKEIMKHFNYPADRITVIYRGVGKEFRKMKKDYEKFGLDPNYKYILYIGTEEKRKNVPLLIRAFYKLKKELKNIKLIKNSRSPETDELISRLGLEKDIINTGYIAQGDIPHIYNIADVFVFPSLYEGFGAPPLEAMACGVPLITSNATSLPEIVGNAGLMINPYDINALTKSMSKVLTDEQLRKEMGKKSLLRAKLFPWEKTAKNTLKIYREL